MAVDTSGNVFVTWESGGCGTQYSGYVTIRYNSAGQEQWVAHYCRGFGSGAKAIAVDNSGNVYVTGARRGFGGGIDYATVKYNAAGQQQWVVHDDGPEAGYSHSTDDPAALAVDGLGNVYVTGYSVWLRN